MLSKIDTAAHKMVTQMQQQEIIANNLANVKTVGFKKDTIYFKKIFDTKAQVAKEKPVIVTDFTPGEYISTTDPLECAIDGNGFFCVTSKSNEFYTRNGAFTLDKNGYLATHTGELVLGKDGPIKLDNNLVDINKEGEIYANGSHVGTLKICHFEDPTLLVKSQENGLFSISPNTGIMFSDQNSEIHQCMLEQSNVSSTKEMISMIKNFRSYESNSKVINILNALSERSIRELGKV